MKKLVITFIALFVLTSAADNRQVLPEKINVMLKNCIMLTDMGMAESAMGDFEFLLKEYPDNAIIQYEHLYALYKLNKYDEVIKTARKLIKKEEVFPLVYHLYGNALDNTGKTSKARKIYLEGLKRFPATGILHMELGVLAMRESKYEDALEQFENGIVVTPSFPSNYFRAADLYLCSDQKTWGLIYAETAVLLAPNDTERHAYMANAIRDCWMSILSFDTENDTITSCVSLTPTRDVNVGYNGVVYLDFPGVFEGCASKAARKVTDRIFPFTASIAQLAELRRGILDAYFEMTDNLYGNSMYLFPFQKEVLDSGHWEAYNYFIFKDVGPEEFDKWYAGNVNEMRDFIDWYNSKPFSIDFKHTVSKTTVFHNYRKIDLEEALTIQAKLLTDKSYDQLPGL